MMSMKDKTMKQKIGKGSFTTAYLLDDGTVELHSCDGIKECMALGWFPESRLFPEIERVDDDTYHTRYYERPRSLKQSLNGHDWKLYKALRELNASTLNPHDKFHAWHEQFDTLPDEFADEREALHEALDACGNYGSDIQFEISPRNVAVDNGQLILLDCFYIISQLYKVVVKR